MLPTFTIYGDAILTEEDLAAAYAKWVLELCNGNKSQAARKLGIDRRSLYRRLGGCPCDNKEPVDAASD